MHQLKMQITEIKPGKTVNKSIKVEKFFKYNSMERIE